MNSETENLNQLAKNTDTQNKLLSEFLLSGQKVIQAVAMQKMGIGHLPRRILDLKQYYALPIKSEWTKYVRQFDNKTTRVKEYWIPIDLLAEVKKTFNISVVFAKDEHGHFINKK